MLLRIVFQTISVYQAVLSSVGNVWSGRREMRSRVEEDGSFVVLLIRQRARPGRMTTARSYKSEVAVGPVQAALEHHSGCEPIEKRHSVTGKDFPNQHVSL